MNTASEIVISQKAQEQLRSLLEQSEKINQQINTYVSALSAGLEVPDGYQLDIRRMAFVAPPAAEGAPTHDAE